MHVSKFRQDARPKKSMPLCCRTKLRRKRTSVTLWGSMLSGRVLDPKCGVWFSKKTAIYFDCDWQAFYEGTKPASRVETQRSVRPLHRGSIRLASTRDSVGKLGENNIEDERQ